MMTVLCRKITIFISYNSKSRVDFCVKKGVRGGHQLFGEDAGREARGDFLVDFPGVGADLRTFQITAL